LYFLQQRQRDQINIHEERLRRSKRYRTVLLEIYKQTHNLTKITEWFLRTHTFFFACLKYYVGHIKS